jgi:hypothetical protein
MDYNKDFSDYTPENTFKVATFAGDAVLAHWVCGYVKSGKRMGEPYGFWEYISVKSDAPGYGSYGKSGKLVKFSEKTPSDFSAFVPPAPQKPAIVAAAKNELPFRVCDESRKRRDELQAQGYTPAFIVEALTKEFPPEKSEKSILDF